LRRGISHAYSFSIRPQTAISFPMRTAREIPTRGS
jgi:hypothetical protein